MKKQCDRFMEEILSSDESYSEEVRRHIRTCPSCRVVASEWEAVRSSASRRETPDIVDFSIRNAASARHQRVDYYKHIIHRLVYVTAAAACVLLVFSIFLFSDKRLAPVASPINQNPAATMWISNLDKGLLTLDTEIEINRRLISISQDNVDYEKILFPEEETDSGGDDYPVDEDYLL